MTNIAFRRARRITVLALVTLCSTTAQTLAPIAANDNRIPAGKLQSGVLHLDLEMRKGNWFPEKDDGESIPTYAFGEVGKPLQVPGPTIRVPEGTTIEISLRNTLAVAATLYGFHQRPGDNKDVLTIEPGASRRISFKAGLPGTYLYWARTPDGRRGNGRVLDALLGGALVVDRPGADTSDRIFVFERWNGPTRTAINGKSWPFTERLNYEVGQQVKWRLVNASDLSHPMHLHGFYFSLDAIGDGERYQSFPPEQKPLEFTHSVQVAETFDMSWVPREPGRWLYHCHRIPHMRLPVPLTPGDAAPAQNHDHEHMHHLDSDYAGMGGMILGITVSGRSEIDTSTDWKPRQRLELAVGTRKDDPRFFALELQNLAKSEEKPRLSTGLTGPPIILTQNEPAGIEIVNRLRQPTTIHWHGIEMQSYYDGVHGWGGRDEKRTPAVLPGERFTVRMIPPRAGTFMYHTHWHDEAQLSGGVHGPLIILPPGQAFNAETDRSFLFSQGPGEPFGASFVLMNGSPQPAALRLRTGVTYRFRFINITATLDNLRVSLRRGDRPVEWRQIAKDASPTQQSPLRPADQLMAISETYDFEYRADTPGELTLTGWNPGDNRRAVQTLIFADAR